MNEHALETALDRLRVLAHCYEELHRTGMEVYRRNDEAAMDAMIVEEDLCWPTNGNWSTSSLDTRP